ncbi:hypothetical protein [Aquimarina longa]|uniref:hypothetical protein n=1 Tax=Aquimarina longa TaxID=1080221 RepID=UPI000782C251|nr:hypothetical protein [Aquimarina longa]
MTDIEIYLGHLGFRSMANKVGREVQKTIARTLQEAAGQPSTNLSHTLHKNITARVNQLARNPLFRKDFPGDVLEIKDITYTDRLRDGELRGTMVIANGYVHDPVKYGKPGYPGREDGQLWQDEIRNTYKWHEGTCKWYLLKDHPNHYGKVDERKEWGMPQLQYSRHNTDRGGATLWGSSDQAGGYGIEPRDSNPTDHNKWGSPGIAPRGEGPLKGENILLVFNLVVSGIKSIKKFYDIYVKADEVYGGSEKQGKSEKLYTKNMVDTVTYRVSRSLTRELDAKVINGSISDVIGRENAEKDSIYHTKKNTPMLKYTIKIEPKYAQ